MYSIGDKVKTLKELTALIADQICRVVIPADQVCTVIEKDPHEIVIEWVDPESGERCIHSCLSHFGIPFEPIEG